MPTTVNIVLKQKKRFFELLEFDYIPIGNKTLFFLVLF